MTNKDKFRNLKDIFIEMDIETLWNDLIREIFYCRFFNSEKIKKESKNLASKLYKFASELEKLNY